MEDGLPSNNVNDIYRDSHGIVWIATDAGLYEFTGNEVGFRSALLKLQGDRITSLCQSKDGNILISVSGEGLFLFDGRVLSRLSSINNKLNGDINCMYSRHSRNEILLGTSEGLVVVRNRNNKWETVGDASVKDVNILKIRSDKDGIFWFGRDNFPNAQYRKGFLHSKITNDSIADYIPTIDLNKKEQKNVSIRAQLLLNLKSKTILCDVLEIKYNQSGDYYLLAYFEKGVEYRKVLIYNGKKFADISSAYDLNSFFIQSLFLENDNLWLGSREHGLIQIKKSKFDYFDFKMLGVGSEKIKDITTNNNGEIFLSTDAEVLAIRNDSVINRIEKGQFCKLISNRSSCNRALRINNISLDKKGELWISSNRGFFNLDPQNFRLNYKGILSSEKFIITRNNEFFCQHRNELRFYSLNGLLLDKPVYKFSKSSKIIISKIIEKGDDIWISTKQKGIVRFSKGEYQNFNRSNSGIYNIVNDMLFISDSTLIAGGNNGVIYKIKVQDNKLEVIDSLSNKDGLNGVSIRGFQYLKDSSLWCGTNQGVHRFEFNSWRKGETLSYRFWNTNDGYSDQTGDKSVVDNHQNIWVLTNNRILRIKTKVFPNRKSSRKLVLSKVQIQNKDWVLDSSKVDKWTKSPLNPIVLGYNENFVNFKFAYEFCDNPSNLLYQYKLEGLEDNWSSWTKSNKVSYSNLPSGTYRLKVNAKYLSEGNITSYSIIVQIETPWWRQLWFIIVMSIFLACIFCFSILSFMRHVKKKEKIRTKQFRRAIGLKIKALQYQLGPHFLFNSLNSIQSYILEDKQEMALNYLSDFSMVLRQNIDNANKDEISLSEEISYLKHYLNLEQMRCSHSFHYSIETGSNINTLSVKLPPMLIQPLLENEIKFGIGSMDKKGELRINFDLNQNEYLKCVITDNGIGRKASKINCTERDFNSYCEAVQITKNRIKLLNQINPNGDRFYYKIIDLEDVDKNSFGTKVEFGFPKNH